MPKKKLSDIVFQRISPPDHKTSLTVEDLSGVLVRRLGLKRKESRADHSKLLLEFIKFKKENIPLSIEKISQVLGVSQSQTYEEIRKWRSLGLVEFIKMPSGEDFIKGYMLTSNTANRLLDRVEAATKSFMRKTRRIAKDFDDLLMLGIARAERPEKPASDAGQEEEKQEEVTEKEEKAAEEEIAEEQKTEDQEEGPEDKEEPG